MKRLLLLVAALPCLFLAWRSIEAEEEEEEGLRLSPEMAERSQPPPTEHWLDEEAEQRNKRGREAWIEQMHRTAPGVDWRAIERQNAEASMARRNQLAANGASFLQVNPWGEIGSRNQAGRMMCASLSPDGALLYAGSHLGGLWRGNYDGTGWTPLGDNLYGGVHELLALPGENAGEPDVLVIANSSLGLRVTRDQGQSWETPSGLGSVTSIRELRVFSDAARTVLVWAQTNFNGNAPALFASTDYARTFTKRFQMQNAGDSDAWVPRTGPLSANNVFVAHRGRIYRSTDGGSTFPLQATLDTTASDAVLTGSEAGAPTLYVALDSGGWKIYRSDTAGTSANLVHTPSDFWGEMCASTVDSQTVVYGGMEAFRSTNGGASFAKINTWNSYYGDPLHKLHADTMGLYAWPSPQSPNGEVFLFCMDGGIWRSHSSGASPLNVSMSGLGVSQYYSTLTSSSNSNLILAGAQDQGYQRGSYVQPTGSGPSTDFAQLISGDYGHLTSSNGTHQLVYSNYPGFTLVQEGQGNPSLVGYIDFPAGSDHLWLPPIAADPLDANSYFLCAEKLYRFTRGGPSTWNPVVHSTQDFAAGSARYLTALAFAPSDAQRAYGVDDIGRLFYSTNHGTTWTPSASTGPPEHYFYGNALAVHPSDPSIAVVGGSGYSAVGVKRTTNGGQTWNAFATGLPPTLVYDLVFARDGSDDVYAAAEAGAFRYDASAGTWIDLTANQSPLTTYWSVEPVGTGLMRFGTYGRGIWDYQITAPPVIQTYCTAKLNSLLCVPAMSWTGVPSAVGGGAFQVTASQILENKNGLLFYGFEQHAGLFQGGFLCVKAPVQRTAIQNSGGSGTCAGTYAYDMNARIQSGLDPLLTSGATVYCQYWYRDPQDSFSTGLSDALLFLIP